MAKATIAGVQHDVPDIWIAGFCTANKCSPDLAILHWHSQWELENQTMETCNCELPPGTSGACPHCGQLVQFKRDLFQNGLGNRHIDKCHRKANLNG